MVIFQLIEAVWQAVLGRQANLAGQRNWPFNGQRPTKLAQWRDVQIRSLKRLHLPPTGVFCLFFFIGLQPPRTECGLSGLAPPSS